MISTINNFWNSDSGVTGQKRPSDNAAENNCPTAKKANTANLEVVKDEGEKVVEEYPIPDQLVGLVIGRGGENIQRIQAETNVSEKLMSLNFYKHERRH